jgi:membrane fusion protein (multidrug efflux system)
VGLLAAGWWWSTGRFLESTDNAAIAGDIAVLSARVEGEVAAILVEDNQPVQAGQALIRLDDRDWRSRVAEAEAGLAEARAAVVTLTEQIAQQRAQVDAAAAELDAARAERARAEGDFRRAGQLAGGGYASRQARDRAEADLRKAEAGVAAAQAGLEAQRRALPVLEANRDQARARRDHAEAALGMARHALADTVIRAPVDGIAANRAAQLGEQVRPGQPLIAIAPPPARQWVVANFKETQLARMRIGQPVRLTVDAIPDVALTGRLASLAPATGSQFSLLPPENATGNFTKVVQRVPVRIALDPEATAKLVLLRPGLSVVAEVDTRDDPTRPSGLFAAAAGVLRDAIGAE